MKYLTFFVLFFLLSSTISAQSIKNKQKKYARVRSAYVEKEQALIKLHQEKGFSGLDNDIFIRAFKKEEVLELWAKNKVTKKYILIKEYNFCANSGVLGPKRKEGDLQIPEGVYYMSYFNAWSNYHLALKVSYPNESDKILSDKKQPGSDIYIHGDCCTIGCIPLTDDKIKELYILCIEAKNAGQLKIPIHIFPTKLTNENFTLLKSEHLKNVKKISFWENLKPIYLFFVETKQIPIVKINKKGEYHIVN